MIFAKVFLLNLLSNCKVAGLSHEAVFYMRQGVLSSPNYGVAVAEGVPAAAVLVGGKVAVGVTRFAGMINCCPT